MLFDRSFRTGEPESIFAGSGIRDSEWLKCFRQCDQIIFYLQYLKLADDAVSRELVSAPNSLISGKFTGKFANQARKYASVDPSSVEYSGLSYAIPYAKEQGICVAVSGKAIRKTGNLIGPNLSIRRQAPLPFRYI